MHKPLYNRTFSRRPCRAGFTLLEIMLVVVIIGLLAAIGIPAFLKARDNSVASRLANDWRIFESAFQIHATDTGNWAPDGIGNAIPAGMADYLKNTTWLGEAPNGGVWDWDFNAAGVVVSVSLQKGEDMPGVFERVDRILDDGNLGSGRFIENGDRFSLLLDQ